LSEYMLKLATRRRTARIFAKTPIDLENIVYSVRVAVQAPSGANRQP
jgi:nitroreductase